MSLPEFKEADIASHNSRNDLWIVIHGKVYNVTEYAKDHPGGVDMLLDVAGTDGTEAYDDVGHSEDANEIMKSFLVGKLEGAEERASAPTRTVQLAKPPVAKVEESVQSSSGSSVSAGGFIKAVLVTGSLGGLGLLYAQGGDKSDVPKVLLGLLPPSSKNWASFLKSGVSASTSGGGGRGGGARGIGWMNALALTTSVFAGTGAYIMHKLSELLDVEDNYTQYPKYIKSSRVAKLNPHDKPGFLDAKNFKKLPLVAKDEVAPNVFRFVFALPNKKDAVGLPIGQHVAIRATIDGAAVSRSYTPTSNNLDYGRLELVVKCYPDGLLTGKYMANLKVGDSVAFRGPKGAMRYRRGLCKKIGMVAGGTGITPMYQLIRAICEDDRDLTEVSLVYANRTEGDILLRKELEYFAKAYPKNFRLYYMLDQPPEKGWKYGKGFVTRDVLKDRLPEPAPDTKVMMCGPPGMLNAVKKALVDLGFQAPGAVSKMTDQIFTF